MAVRLPGVGHKRVCVSCAARFYDLARMPPVCPKCGTEQPPEPPRPPPMRRAPPRPRQMKPIAADVDEDAAPVLENEDEEADADEDEAAEPDEEPDAEPDETEAHTH